MMVRAHGSRIRDNTVLRRRLGTTAGVDTMTDPCTVPFEIMQLADCAALASQLITSTAQLETLSTQRRRISGPVHLVTIT